MPAPEQNEPLPVRRIRFAPSRGPVHLLALLVTVIVTMALPLAYLLAVQALGLCLGWSTYRSVYHLVVIDGHALQEWCRLVCLVLAGAGWVSMIRPLLPAEKKNPAAILVTKNTQPSLFALIETLCRHLQMPMPEEVWFDCAGSVRTTLRGGIGGIAKGGTALFIGLPMVAVLGAREFAAALAQELGQYSGGIGVTPTHLVREMNAWFFRALYHRDPWVEALEPRAGSDNKTERPVIVLLRRTVRAGIWLTQRPFWLLMFVARAVSLVPMQLITFRSARCAVRLIGAGGFTQLQHKRRLLATSMRQARSSVDEGLGHLRLPENFTLLVARIFTSAMDASPPPAPRRKEEKKPPAARLIDQLPASAEAAALIRQFIDLARQISYFYYQHELGIPIHQHRMVSHDESLYQKRHQHEALAVIRRYFGGVMHPERALCHLTVTGTTTDTGDLAQTVVAARQWQKQYQGQMRLAVREWNLAWQRRRDLECAWVLTLAGYSVCRLDYGTEQSTPETYRQEAKAQKMIMDHLDDPLRLCEAQLEKRLAAALGMLWHSQPEILPDRLLEMRRHMPLWAHVYEALAAVLPEFRELLTSFYSFQTLGGRVASVSESGAFASALQSIVPGMMARARHISKALDGACYPFNPDGIAIPLSDYLCASLGGSAHPDPRTALGMHAMARQMAHDAALMLTPFVDRFLELYHRSFAWLAAAAEASENYFVGPAYADEIVSSEVESLAGLIKTETAIKQCELATA
ncbi:MAG: hypothetical protein K1X78_16640 [Verrucomicrobiaceae bacterium]|nr:hypothetical protein [Verrucomicrobiaceae bacterium]